MTKNTTGIKLRSEWHDYVAAAGPLLLTLTMGQQVHQLILELDSVRRRGSTVYLIGNGGSASAASHLAQDLLKGTSAPGNPALRALALTDNLSTLTAYGNDLGYEHVFLEPLKLLACGDDYLLAISCSGTRPNVVAAARYTRTVGMAVTAGNGGDLRGRPTWRSTSQRRTSASLKHYTAWCSTS